VRSEDKREREDRRFVLRFWREPSAGWRGSVYEVSSAFGIASGKLRDLWDFVTLRLGQGSEPRDARETHDEE
jgi:hypothetical protein